MATAAAKTTVKKGTVVQVIGATLDAEFEEGHLPDLYNALTIDVEQDGQRIHLTSEVQQHLGRNRARAGALGSTDGLVRGTEVIDTGGPISVPVGESTLGRVFNLLGNPVDEQGPLIDVKERRPIHRPAPPFDEIVAQTQVFETGLKVV